MGVTRAVARISVSVYNPKTEELGWTEVLYLLEGAVVVL